MADDSTDSSKLSEEYHKDLEDFSEPKREERSEEEMKQMKAAIGVLKRDKDAAKKKLKESHLKFGDGKGLGREIYGSIRGNDISDSSGVEDENVSEIETGTEIPMRTEIQSEIGEIGEKSEAIKAEVAGFSNEEDVTSDLTKSESTRSVDADRIKDEITDKVEESTQNVLGSTSDINIRLNMIEGSQFDSDPSDEGTVTPDIAGFNAKNEDDVKKSESVESEKESGSSSIDLEIDTNMDGLREELYDIARQTKKGKEKLEKQEKDYAMKKSESASMVDLEIHTNIEGLEEAMSKLPRQATEGTKNKLNSLLKNFEESSDEESDEERGVLNVLSYQMLELNNAISSLEVDLEILMSVKDKYGKKLRQFKSELELLKHSNYEKEIEIIDLVKNTSADIRMTYQIDAYVHSEVHQLVKKAEAKMAQVKSELRAVEMDRNKKAD